MDRAGISGLAPEGRAKTKIIGRARDGAPDVRGVLRYAFSALEEKGYDPLAQITSYLVTGDPVYITNHREARSRIRQLDPTDIVRELLRDYLGGRPPGGA